MQVIITIKDALEFEVLYAREHAGDPNACATVDHRNGRRVSEVQTPAAESPEDEFEQRRRWQ